MNHAKAREQRVETNSRSCWSVAPHQRWLLIAAGAAVLVVGVMFHPKFDPSRMQSFLVSAFWPLFWCLGLLFWSLRHSAGQFSLRAVFVILSGLSVAFAVGRAVHPAAGAALVGGLLAIGMLRDVWRHRRSVLRPHDQCELGVIGAAGATMLVHSARIALAVWQA